MPRQSDTPKPTVTRARKPRATGTTPKTTRKKAGPAVPSPSETAEVAATSAPSVDQNPPVTASESEPAPAVSHDAIAEAAYQRFLERGGSHGLDFDDWVEAERRLRERT